MTTIVYRDGVLAADTVTSRGNSLLRGVTKIARGPDGRLGGACGSAAFMGEWLAWISTGGERPMPKSDEKYGDDVGLLIDAAGNLEIHEASGVFKINPPYYAMGSGSPEALGALFAGADAETAVKAAIEHDAHTGGDVIVLRR